MAQKKNQKREPTRNKKQEVLDIKEAPRAER